MEQHDRTEYAHKKRMKSFQEGGSDIINIQENAVILSVQKFELSEVPELRWDGASELIQREVPEREQL